MAQVDAVELARHDEQLGDHHNQLKELWTALEKVRDRPPVWVSWVLSGAAFILGIMSTLLVQCAPFVK
ncbi:MAG: hypothetical protein K0S79_89 [Nitrospira sp.]|jgi:hypothetical protein|nr:hypothetical protein [Nitrospira sp.]